MGLGGIGNGKGKARPGTGWVEGAFVVPGTKQAKDFAAERTGEETIHLIHCLDNGPVDLTEYFAPQEAFEIDIRAAFGVPNIPGDDIEIELIRYPLRDREIECFDGLKVGGIEFLEVGLEALRPGSAPAAIPVPAEKSCPSDARLSKARYYPDGQWRRETPFRWDV